MAGSLVNVTINGLAELNAKLSEVKNISPELIKAMNKGGGLVSGRAKYRCPVDTGYLRNSIHIHPAEVIGNAVTVIVYTATEYAGYVEFGTGMRGGYPYPTGINLSYDQEYKGQVAQPYMMPALLESKSQINDIVSEAVIKAAMKGSK